MKRSPYGHVDQFYIKIKLNANLNSFLMGSVIPLVLGGNSISLNDYWHRRLEDSKIDNCVQIVNDNSDIIIIPAICSRGNYSSKIIKNDDSRELLEFYDELERLAFYP